MKTQSSITTCHEYLDICHHYMALYHFYLRNCRIKAEIRMVSLVLSVDNQYNYLQLHQHLMNLVLHHQSHPTQIAIPVKKKMNFISLSPGYLTQFWAGTYSLRIKMYANIYTKFLKIYSHINTKNLRMET